MGTAASSNPQVGVPGNPRVLYAKDLSKKEHKDLSVDAPVLVDVEHGSLRYRLGDPNQKTTDYRTRKEKPFEGEERVNKRNYFYHARLNDFSEGGSKDKEDQFKFTYVAKGPTSAKQKKVFYVYGIGWNAVDGTRTLPTASKDQGNDYSWPETRIPNHVYYDLSFIAQDCELEEDSMEDRLVGDLSSTANRHAIELTLSDEDTARVVKRKLASKILKSASMIHVSVHKREIREEDIIGDMREDGQGTWKTFRVILTLY